MKQMQIQPTPYGDQEASRRKFVLLGCAAAIVLLAVIILVTIRFLLPALSSKTKGLTGDFLSAAAVAGPDGEARLWILSDGSFQYISRTESPGRISVGRKCKFCKTWMYVYDPAAKTVLAKFKTDYKSLILQTWMTSIDGKIWVASDAYDQNEPRIFVYSADPPGLVRETPAIVNTYPELRSGLIKVRMAKDPDRLIMDTKDGRVGLVLALQDEKLYANEVELRKARAAADEEQVTVFALGLEDGGPRKLLFKVTGPRGRVMDSSLEFFLRNPDSLKHSARATAQPITPDRAYIDGVIFYQDADCCLILYQDAAGQTANRLLACIDANGNEKWTAGQDALFKEIKVDLDKNALTKMFFLKDEIAVSRLGSLILFQVKGLGAIGFDFATGQKLWEIKL